MSDERPIHFEVQLSEPYEYLAYGEQPGGKTQKGNHNVTINVITTSAQRAIELALQRHPEGTVHVVQRRGFTNLLVDPYIIHIIKEVTR